MGETILVEASDFDAANPPAQAEADGFSMLPQPGKVSLKLSGKNVGPENCQSLAAGLAQLTQLTGLILDLRFTEIGADGGSALAGALAHLAQMTTLDLNLWGNDLGTDGVSALAGAFAHLAQMTTLALNLRATNLGADGGSALAGAFAHLAQITTFTLDLSLTNLGSDGVSALAGAFAHLAQMTTLDLNLSETNLGSDGVSALAGAFAHLVQVTTLTLNLSKTNLGADGGSALAGAFAHLAQMTTLDLNLCGNDLGADGGSALAGALAHLVQMTTLDLNLWGNDLGTDGVSALAGAFAHLAQITTLDLNLCGNDLGADGGSALAYALAHLGQMTTLTLNLSKTNLGADGGSALAGAFAHLAQITTLSLDLSGNDLGADVGTALAGALAHLVQMTTFTLNLSRSKIGADGGSALAGALAHLAQITTLSLDLSQNDLGADGGSALAGALAHLAQITTLSLDLSLTNLGADVVSALADAFAHLPQLTELTLNVYGEILPAAVCEALGAAIAALPQLTTLKRWGRGRRATRPGGAAAARGDAGDSRHLEGMEDADATPEEDAKLWPLLPLRAEVPKSLYSLLRHCVSMTWVRRGRVKVWCLLRCRSCWWPRVTGAQGRLETSWWKAGSRERLRVQWLGGLGRGRKYRTICEGLPDFALDLRAEGACSEDAVLGFTPPSPAVRPARIAMDGSWATVVPGAAAASNELPRPSAAGAAGGGGTAPPTRLIGRLVAERLRAALRQGVRRRAQVAAETLEADETCRTSARTSAQTEANQEQREDDQVEAMTKSRGAQESEELKLLMADIAEQMELLHPEPPDEAKSKKALLVELAELQGAEQDQELKVLMEKMAQQTAISNDHEERFLRRMVDLGRRSANRKAEAQLQKKNLLLEISDLLGIKHEEELKVQFEEMEKSASNDMEERVLQAMVDLGRRAASKAEAKTYDLNDRGDFAQFLLDADIRLVRGRSLIKWHEDGMKLPRRQEAEAMLAGPGTALVTHEEMEIWAKGPNFEQLNRYEKATGAATANIVAVSHVWEAREHPDPHGYQLRKLAEVAAADAWYFLDYTSLYQFRRSTANQDESFRRAMQNMHVLYAHEHSFTLRIESLTPDAEMDMDSKVLVYHAPSGQVRPVAVKELMANRTAYRDRGWCIAEWQWSAARSTASRSKEIDEGPDAAGQAPMPPEVFLPMFRQKLKFTHRSDKEAVLDLQKKVFHEKAKKNQTLKLTRLSSEECEVALKALWHYPVLRRIEISHSVLGDLESFLGKVFEVSSVPKSSKPIGDP
eukprot:s1256_g10.t1